MFTTSFTSPRRLAGYLLTLLLLPVWLCADAGAQMPAVVSSSPVAVPHNESYANPWQTAVSNHGDFVLFDFKTSGTYQYPGNGGAEITLAAPGKIAGGFTDSGIAIDPRNNNLYLNNNYNGGLLEYPYDVKTGTWDLPSVTVAGGLAGNLGGSCGNYFQSAGLAINDNGVMAVATENGCGVEIFTVPIDASGNFGSATPIVANMSARAKTVAIDDAGNISFNEDAGGLIGAYFIPAGVTGLTTDKQVLRIDPALGAVQGVTIDRAGNVYVADGAEPAPSAMVPNPPIAGTYLVPLQSGAPNPAQAVLLTTAAANGGPSLDQAHGILFLPTTAYAGFKDVVKIDLNRLELGSSAVGVAGATPGTITYTFGGTATPYSFAIEENSAAGDFALGSLSGCGITFTTDPKTMVKTETATTYAAGATCTLPVSITPTTVGGVSATVFMLDAKGNVLASTIVHGAGQGSLIAVAPATESALGSGLKTPSQVAVDASGNVYIADSGLGKVVEYAKGSGASATPVSIGTGLSAPTGVAVDWTGNVYIADSGKVFEVPFTQSGVNSAGQTTLLTGLGSNVTLAVDKIGDLFAADPANQRVVQLRQLAAGSTTTTYSGFTQLSAIAADGVGNLYVANGANLVEQPTFGVQTTLLSSLSAANGLAVDPSGAVYVSSSAQTIRIPSVGGTLNPAGQMTIGTVATKPASVAVDALGNAYVLDANAEDVDLVSTNGSLNLGTLATVNSTQSGTVTIVNSGNAPLTVTGYSSTADFSEKNSTCVGTPVAAGASCSATILFNPGNGDQGPLSGQLLVQANQINTPTAINLIGVGAALAGSTTTVSVNKPSVTNAPVIVTVAPATGTSPVPTGNVTLTVTNSSAPAVVLTQALVNGTTTFNETGISAGADTFTANYAGDRVYGTSTGSTKTTVAQGTVTLVQPAASAVPIYVLSSGTGSQEPYDGTDAPYYYSYPVTVKTANGAPLIGVPVRNAAGTQTGVDYGNVTYSVTPGTPVCTGNSAIINVNADGTVPFPTRCLNIDTSNNQIPDLTTSYTFTPIYGGDTDPNYAAVTGTPVTVIALRNPMVIITSNPGTLSVAAGSSATTKLTLTSLLGYGVAGATANLHNYSLPLELECDALPAHASCTFTYPTPDPSDANSVAVNPTTPGTVMMTLNTNVAVGTTTSSLRTNPAVYAGIFGLGMLGLAWGRKKTLRASLFRVLCVLSFAASLMSFSACSSANISATPVLATPGGQYTITVTAKQVGSKTIPGSTPGTTQVVYGNGNQMSIPFTMSVTIH